MYSLDLESEPRIVIILRGINPDLSSAAAKKTNSINLNPNTSIHAHIQFSPGALFLGLLVHKPRGPLYPAGMMMPPGTRQRSMSQRMKMRARTMSLRAIGVHEGDDLDMRSIKVSNSENALCVASWSIFVATPYTTC